MPDLVTERQIDARVEAYQQAIGSLTVGIWTDDPEEQRQGVILAKQLERNCDRWYRKQMTVKKKG